MSLCFLNEPHFFSYGNSLLIYLYQKTKQRISRDKPALKKIILDHEATNFHFDLLKNTELQGILKKEEPMKPDKMKSLTVLTDETNEKNCKRYIFHLCHFSETRKCQLCI